MNAAKIQQIIDRSLQSGEMTQREHDDILLMIQQDGEIDAQESAFLSRISAAVNSGELRIVDSERERRARLESEHAREKSAYRAQLLDEQRERAKSISGAIDRAIACGEMTQREHDRIMKSMHADGQLDEAEKEELSRLFTALSSGRVTLVDDHRSSLQRTSRNDRLLNEFTQEAMIRDQQRSEAEPAGKAGQAAPQREARPPSEARLHSEAGPPGEAAEPELFSGAPTAAGGTPAAAPPAAPQPGTAAAASPAAEIQGQYDIASFVDRAHRRRTSGPSFALLNDRLLDVNLNGLVWTKAGAMVGYYGSIKFTREGVFEHGLGRTLKRAATGEGAALTKATGVGTLYLADQGKKISIFNISGYTLVVNGRNLLAFEEGVAWDITLLKQFASIWSGGLFNVRLSGNGLAAITSFFDPVVLQVKPGEPVMTDMQATVAWSGGLAPQFKTDIAANTLIGRTSGETVQMRFEGDGFVIIQPYEDPLGPSS